ncbi:MAG: response regulator transcription factor [Pararhodobacter sp.]
MRILLIEDHAMLARALVQALGDQGHGVDWVADGLEAGAWLHSESPDMIILDLTLPGRDGLDLLRELRAAGSSLPVLALTARDGPGERVAGFEAGADDYLTKPFEMAELQARVLALGRRSGQLKPVVETLGELRFDRALRSLTGPEGLVSLSRRERALFEALLDFAGRVAGKEMLCARIYGTGADIEDNAIELLVSRLRKKLAGTGVEIRTLRGLGYLMRARQ